MAQTAAVADDRPHLVHHTDNLKEYGLPDDTSMTAPTETGTPGPVVAPGIALPSTGRLYALDNFGGKAELVHLKYKKVDLNNHTGSNLLKTQAAPFIYKPKKTVEITGSSAEVKLHEAMPVFFIRYTSASEESADGSDPCSLSLLRLDVKPDRRVAAAIAFTQLTGHASRSESIIDTADESVRGGGWHRIRPKEPLAPGEYGWMCLPHRQNTFATVIYDFAIDAAAPENADAIVADPAKSPVDHP